MSINVANNNPHVVYTVAEGATQTVFSITFEFFDDDEVQLYVDGIIKTQGSGDGKYTITGGEGSTGTATFNTVSSGTQPVTGITGGSQVVVTRNIPIERVTDFSAGSDINRAALNTQLDTLTAIAADNKMRSVRALTAPISDPTDVGTNLIIPKAADRANGFLSFDSSGNVGINSVVDLSFLTLERLDIDNVRIDGSTISSIDSGALTIGSELIVSGNLTVNGTTTTINSTTLTVDDKNIVLASGAANSTAANGAGITIDGANATLTYVHLTEAMTFNKDVDIGDNVIENAQKLHFTENVSLYPSDGDDSILNLQTEDSGAGQLRFITGTGAGAFRGGVVASTSNIFGLKDSNDQIFIKSQDGNLPTQILHTYDSPSAGNVVRIEAGSTYVKLYGSDGVEAQKYKDADDTSYYLEPAGTSVLATVGVTQLNVDNITIDGNTISSTDTDGNINLRCNGNGVVDVDSELFVYGNATNGTAAYVQIGNTDTGGDDVRIQGPNPNFSLYDSTAVADGVAAYTGGLLFHGQKTNTAYHTYSAIRPRIINGLDSDTAKTGALHFGVSDGASSALTNIIFKVEPDGIDVTGSITSSSNPLKISATTTSSTANIILEGDTSPILSLRASGSNDDKISFKSDGAFQYINTNDQLTIQTGTNDALFLFGSSNIRTDALGGTHTISSRAGDISFITGTSGSTTERLKITGAGLVQSLSETQIVDETLKVTNGSTYGSLSMDENTGSSRDYFDIKAFGHDGSSTEGGAVRLFSASNLESIRTYSTGTTGAGYTTFNFPYDLSYGTGVYHLTVASANRSGLYLRSDVSGSDADGKQYGELSASSSELKMVGWFGANIEFKIGGDSGETKIAEINSNGLAFEDNKKAIFGAGSDLQIYHDPSGPSSLISDQGAGDLILRGSNQIRFQDATGAEHYAIFNENGAVQLYYDNAAKLATTSTGVDITGVLTSDGLTVDGDGTFSATNPTVDIKATNGNDASLILMETTGNDFGANGANGFRSRYDGGDNALYIQSGAETTIRNRIKVDRDTGDISFYEDTGTTAKLHWSAADEVLSLKNTASVANFVSETGTSFVVGDGTGGHAMTIYTGTGSNGSIYFADGSSGNATYRGGIQYLHGSDSMRFNTAANNAVMTLDSSGNVGIGAVPVGYASVLSALQLGGNANIAAESATGASQFLHISQNANFDTDTSWEYISTDEATSYYQNSGTHVWRYAASGTAGNDISWSEAMRIDSSGNLLVGQSSTTVPGAGNTTAGTSIRGTDGVFISRTTSDTSASALQVNKNTGQGAIINIASGGTTVGSVGVNGGDNLQISASTADHAGLEFATHIVAPLEAGAASNGTIDLGADSARFKDLYLSGGVYLGGTGSANYLTDYEYGTFTPTYTGSSSNPSGVTYDPTVGNKGIYVKVGRAVFIQINIRTDAISNVGSGNLKISGLPFATAALSGNGGVASLAIGQVADFAGEAPFSCYVDEGLTTIQLFFRSSVTGSSSASQCSDLATGTNDNLIRISGTYYSTA